MDNRSPKSSHSRRYFLKTSAAATLGALATGKSLGAVLGKKGKICIVIMPDDQIASSTPAIWALEHLKKAFESKGTKVRLLGSLSDTAENEFCILASGMSTSVAKGIFSTHNIDPPKDAESLCIVQTRMEDRAVLLVSGSDDLGLVYGLTELADRINLIKDNANALEFLTPVIEKPASRTRSILRNFSSELEDKSWFYDREYWQSYLNMLVSSRVNRFNFSTGMGYNSARNITDGYMLFPYPFFVKVPGYDVSAKGLSEEERIRNLEMLKYIGEETTKRGLHFQFGIWTLAYEWNLSPDATYTIDGLTDASHGPYCRDALAVLLKEVPTISGVTFRVHSESGIPEGAESFWATQFSAVADCGRKVEIDMHAKNMEAETLQAALETKQHVVVSPKYCAEHHGLPYHQASIREKEMPDVDKLIDPGEGLLIGNRRFTRYGYADMLSENRSWDVVFRIWPGNQRFLLNGDPATFAAFGRNASFCGAAGIELSEPLMFKGRRGTGTEGGRCAYTDETLKPGYDFEKYRYTYRLWGRLGYNPDTDEDVWRRALNNEFGSAALAVENALARATRVIPLFMLAHAPSADCSRYWPEIYYNLPMVESIPPATFNFDTREPKIFGNVSSLDPQLFHSPYESADTVLQGINSGKYSSIEVANWLDNLAGTASASLKKASRQLGSAASNPGFRRVEEDVLIQIGLARFFAAKFRSAVLWRIYTLSGSRKAGDLSIENYADGLEEWKTMAERASSVYIENITYGVYGTYGHWMDRIPSFEEDIAMMQKQLDDPLELESPFDQSRIDSAVRFATKEFERPTVEASHLAAGEYIPGKPLHINFDIRGNQKSVKLHYRHVNQSERWQFLNMKKSGQTYEAEIPAGYTNGRFPLQYYFEIETSETEATLFPDLGDDFEKVPYFVVRQQKTRS